MAGDDAAKAYRAVWRLASHPAVSVPYLTGRAKALPAVTDAARLAARPFDRDIVLARRVVEALELAGVGSLGLLGELASHPTYAFAALAVTKRLMASTP